MTLSEQTHLLGMLSPQRSSEWSLYTGSVNGPLNRLEFVTMLYEIAGKPKPGASAAFIDVSNSDAAVWAAETGVVSGDGKGRLLPTQAVTREQALRHPNWDMGAKITIDSATLMNKGLEVIEASWLFDMPEEKIQVVVHRESIIHSMIQYKDHGVIAQLGLPDMAVPIQYALTYPRRLPSPAGELDLCALGALTFCPPDEEAFPCLALCREALRRGGLVPAAANGANEQAVALFLEGKIGFLDIPRLVEAAMARQAPGVVTLEAVLEADKEARAFVAGAAH